MRTPALRTALILSIAVSSGCADTAGGPTGAGDDLSEANPPADQAFKGGDSDGMLQTQDLAQGGESDLAGAVDAAIPPDLSIQIDLAVPPDLTIRPDLVPPPDLTPPGDFAIPPCNLRCPNG